MMNRPMNHNQMHQRQEHHGCDCACREKLQQIRALDFAIQETVLYLDAYPENRQALEYYHTLLKERKETVAEYEQKCGAVTMFGNTSGNAWQWISGPWPWEYDAN
jgi:spore coat protein JB